VRIALDAMGGDHAPLETVAGAVEASVSGVDVILVGDRDRIDPICEDLGSTLPIIHAAEVVGMHEDPTKAIREKPDSSISVAARLVRDGDADALVSAGSTGAALAASAITIGRMEGVLRPAVAAVIPSTPPSILIDAGANPAVGPKHLLQFALMGTVVSEIAFGVADPTVGLLSIGTEPGKGRALERLATELLEQAPFRFVGNVEGRDLAASTVNVVVTDGFTGNVALKVLEGATDWIGALAKRAGRPLPEEIARALDYESTGGAHLVGVKGVVVIAHGSSSRVAIRNAIHLAATAEGVVSEIGRRL
jgi:phosphate acyltransferase